MIDFNATPVMKDGIARFVEADNYADSFGFQWNRFAATQLDREQKGSSGSSVRFWAETGWDRQALKGVNILEAGSGAGRFSQVILTESEANLHSFDYSNAVDANLKSNGAIAPERFQLSQASIYDIPYPDDSFDKVVCLGVLQHTPDFEESVRALVRKARLGGEIVVDFYEIRNLFTKIHAKYLLRPISKRIDDEKLLNLIDRHADRLMRLYRGLGKMGLAPLRRFIPVADFEGPYPKTLSEKQMREWVVLDTFDMMSPEHDHPQRIGSVAKMMERAGADVTFAGHVDNGSGTAAVVRAVKR